MHNHMFKIMIRRRDAVNASVGILMQRQWYIKVSSKKLLHSICRRNVSCNISGEDSK
jgi:hypothetical protein